MGLFFPRWLWTLLHRGTVFVAVRPTLPGPPPAPQQAVACDSTLRLTAARCVH
jgi:hypothetical protein